MPVTPAPMDTLRTGHEMGASAEQPMPRLDRLAAPFADIEAMERTLDLSLHLAHRRYDITHDPRLSEDDRARLLRDLVIMEEAADALQYERQQAQFARELRSAERTQLHGVVGTNRLH